MELVGFKHLLDAFAQQSGSLVSQPLRRATNLLKRSFYVTHNSHC